MDLAFSKFSWEVRYFVIKVRKILSRTTFTRALERASGSLTRASQLSSARDTPNLT